MRDCSLLLATRRTKPMPGILSTTSFLTIFKMNPMPVSGFLCPPQSRLLQWPVRFPAEQFGQRIHEIHPHQGSAASTISRTSTWRFRAISWWSSPGSAGRENPRWRLTPFMPRGSGNTWNRCRLMPGSFSISCRSRTSMRSRDCRRRSRSSSGRPVSNPRITVATTTEIYDYLRVLFARAGTPHCWDVRPGDQPARRRRRSSMR